MNESPGNSDFCRVLALFPNWLGDCVMATELLEVLDRNRSLPDGRRLHLTLGIRRAWAPIFREDPRCDDIFVVERPGRHAGAAGMLRLREDLAVGHFKAVALGPPSLRVALASFLAQIPIRVGYSADGRGPLLAPCLPAPPRGSLHYAQEMRQLGVTLLEELGCSVVKGDNSLRSYLPGLDSVVGAARDGNRPRWILAPGATYGLAKTWPLEQALEFSKLAMEQEGAELIVLGDAEAGNFARDLARNLGTVTLAAPIGTSSLVDLTGRTTLLEAAALLKSASAFVGNDSGLMHLAAALGVPTLGVFGSSNPAWTAPRGPRALALVADGFDCQPCYRKTCNQDTFCLNTLTGSRVFSELKDLLARPSAQQGDAT